MLPVAAPTVSETFHSAVGTGRPAGQYGGWFCWAADCFSCPLIHQWAQQAGYASAGAYLVVGMVGWNFLLETAVNMALTPMMAQLIRLGSRRCL